jgi:hypothetical protein
MNTAWRRWAVDVAILVAIGAVMGFLGPFASERIAAPRRYVYWMICMVGGGLIGVMIDSLLERRVASTWRRVALVSVLMTPLVTLLVLTTQHLVVGAPFDGVFYLLLLPQVLPISLATMTVHALAWRRPPARVETRTVIAPPLPEAEAAFRRPADRGRGARPLSEGPHRHG